MIDILQYNFHDKEIKSINLNSNNDFMDEIDILFIDEEDKILILKCKNCLQCKIEGNGWIVGKDSIRECEIREEIKAVNVVPRVFGSMIGTEFKEILINLNTSNTNIYIIANEILLDYIK